MVLMSSKERLYDCDDYVAYVGRYDFNFDEDADNVHADFCLTKIRLGICFLHRYTISHYHVTRDHLSIRFELEFEFILSLSLFSSAFCIQ